MLDSVNNCSIPRVIKKFVSREIQCLTTLCIEEQLFQSNMHNKLVYKNAFVYISLFIGNIII